MSKRRNLNERLLENISMTRKSSKYGFIILTAMCVICNLLVASLARAANGEMLEIGQAEIPVVSMTGILSAISNLGILLIVVFYKKMGFITSLILLLLQFPGLFSAIFVQQRLSSLPGIFTNILTIISIVIIYINNKRIDSFQTRLRDQAITDRLTGLPNRFACMELMKSFVSAKKHFTVVSIDLNNFKGINNSMGYDMGNKVLINVASRWRAIAESGETGTSDILTRQNGDEFALIIRGYKNEEDIRRTISAYEKVLEDRIVVEDVDFYINASFGYARFPTDSDNTDMLLTYANAAMYEVKRTGSSNRIQRFSPALGKRGRSLEMERMIRIALDNCTLYFALQPQYDISHKLRGFETLARMKDENGSNISPGEFIPVAEKAGLIDKVDSYVFRRSAEFFGELIRKTGTDATLSINVSVRHLMKSDFADEVRHIIASTGIPANQLEIEITESIMIDSAEKALECINEIRAMGIKIAIDDFGTGYSSLSYLNRFPADMLKVDKSFIDKMNTTDSSKQYVAAIISIGHIMNFDVISEGVEEPEQLDTLRSIGCDFIQGYIWGRPMPPEEAEKLVEDSMK